MGIIPNKADSTIKIYLYFRLIDNFSNVCHLHHWLIIPSLKLYTKSNSMISAWKSKT